MANTSLRGFRWLRSLTSDSTKPPIVPVRVASAYNGTVGGTAVDINIGDPITQLSTGYHALAVGSEGTQNLIFGIVAGIGPYWDGTRMVFNKKLPNSSGSYGTNFERMTFLYVIPVLNQVFEVDADDGAAANDTEAEWIALVGQNADHVLTAGSQPDANPLLDISTANTTATLQWRILGWSPKVDNDLTSTRAKVQVVCNAVQFAGTPATFATAI